MERFLSILERFHIVLSDNICSELFTVYCVIEEAAEILREMFTREEYEQKSCDFYITLTGSRMTPQGMQEIEDDTERYRQIITFCQEAVAIRFHSEVMRGHILHAVKEFVNGVLPSV